MTRIVDDIALASPVDEVFAFVSTPATWPKWHPSSLGVSDAIDHSLEVGEQVTEEFLVAGRRGQVVWTVTDKDAPRTWTISGKVIGGGQGVITYHCRPDGNGTIFEREFTYSMSIREAGDPERADLQTAGETGIDPGRASAQSRD